MFISKRKTIAAGIAIAVVMSVGCVTAFAATSKPSLTKVPGKIDFSSIQKGSYTVIKGVVPKTDNSGITADGTSGVTVTGASGVLDLSNVQKGCYPHVVGVVPKPGSSGTTASSASGTTITAVSGTIDLSNVQKGAYTVIRTMPAGTAGSTVKK